MCVCVCLCVGVCDATVVIVYCEYKIMISPGMNSVRRKEEAKARYKLY